VVLVALHARPVISPILLTDRAKVLRPNLAWVHVQTGRSLSAQGVQEVWVLAKPITIYADLGLKALCVLEIILPLGPIVTAFGVLELVQQLLVFVDDLCEILNPVGPIKRVVRVEPLVVQVLFGKNVLELLALRVLLLFQINMKHFSE